MINLKSARSWRVAVLLLICALFIPASAQERNHDKDRDGTRQLKTLFEVTVRQGPSAGLVAYGELTLNLNPRSGDFTGSLTPATNPDTGTPLSTVLFMQSGDSLVPTSTAVPKLDVRGTAQGHAINLIMLDARGVGNDLAGVGTMENSLQEWLRTGTQGFVGGPAIGPEPGDSGDWFALCSSCVLHPVLQVPTRTFDSPLSASPMNVDSWSFSSSTPSFGGTVIHHLSITVLESANPSTFGAFSQNVAAALHGARRFSGTLNDFSSSNTGVTFSFTNMVVTTSTLSLPAANSGIVDTITFFYESSTTTYHP